MKSHKYFTQTVSREEFYCVKTEPMTDRHCDVLPIKKIQDSKIRLKTVEISFLMAERVKRRWTIPLLHKLLNYQYSSAQLKGDPKFRKIVKFGCKNIIKCGKYSSAVKFANVV